MAPTHSGIDAGAPQKRQKRGGRVKGTPNKVTATLKEAVLMAASNAHRDGMVGYLTEQAKKNPTAFMTLLGRVLPTTLASDPTNPMPAPQFIVQPVAPKAE
jgi:hypothetical protein